jgi:hypothetical protein
MSNKDNFIVISIKLKVVILKIGSALGKESLEGFLISLIGARLIYLISLCLLNYIEEINLLLESCNLSYCVLNIIITNTKGG